MGVNTGLAAGAAINPTVLLGTMLGGAGSIADYYGTKDTNKMNAQIAAETNAANERIAQKQMDFQAEMSNSAYQRSMSDMKKAGLNPMLAYQQGGASTPAGAGIPAVSHSYSNALSGAVKMGLSNAAGAASLGREMAATDSQMKLNQANIDSQTSQRQLNVSSAKAKEAEIAKTQAELPSVRERSKLEAAKAKIDQRWVREDSAVDRGQKWIDAGNSAKSLFNVPSIEWKSKPDSPKRNELSRGNNDFLRRRSTYDQNTNRQRPAQ